MLHLTIKTEEELKRKSPNGYKTILRKMNDEYKEFIKLEKILLEWNNLSNNEKTILFDKISNCCLVACAKLNGEKYKLRSEKRIIWDTIRPRHPEIYAQDLNQSLIAEYYMINSSFDIRDHIYVEDYVTDRFANIHPELVTDNRGEMTFLTDFYGYKALGQSNPSQITSTWRTRNTFSPDSISSIYFISLNYVVFDKNVFVLEIFTK